MVIVANGLHCCCDKPMVVRKDAPDVRVLVCNGCDFELMELKPWRPVKGGAA